MAHNKLSEPPYSLLGLNTFAQEDLLLEPGLFDLPHLLHEILQSDLLLVKTSL